jgi:hypothetical protein
MLGDRADSERLDGRGLCCGEEQTVSQCVCSGSVTLITLCYSFAS